MATSDPEHAMVMGVRAAVQVMATYMQMKMDLEEAAQFRELTEAHRAAILSSDIFGSSEERSIMAKTFDSILSMDAPDDDNPATTPNLTIIDGGKDDAS